MTGIPIIGLGAVCAAGNSVETAYPKVAAGADCLSELSLFDGGLKKTPLCGQVDTATLPAVEHNAPNRTTELALHAANEALQALPDRSGLRLGLVYATTVGGMTRSELFYRQFRTDEAAADSAARELAYHEPAANAGFLARTVGAQTVYTMSTACSTGLHAVGTAARMISRNRVDVCLAVGADALSLLTLRGFAALMLVDFDGCKPFDVRRVGISLGEGAGALLLASPKAASQFNGVGALVGGWGAGADCRHMTAPHPEGEGARKAVENALKDAQIPPAKIDLIVTHGTATPDNDLSEIKAMTQVFDPLPGFCSMKRTLGHTLAASGALEAVFAVKALEEGMFPGTGGFEQLDEAVGVAPITAGRGTIRNVLKNSFGFGGNNAALILSAK